MDTESSGTKKAPARLSHEGSHTRGDQHPHMKCLMSFSSPIIVNVALPSHRRPPCKRPRRASQMLSGHKPPQRKSQCCSVAHPGSASTGFTKFSII